MMYRSVVVRGLWIATWLDALGVEKWRKFLHEVMRLFQDGITTTTRGPCHLPACARQH